MHSEIEYLALCDKMLRMKHLPTIVGNKDKMANKF